MSTIINVIIALLVFSAIIFFHELGHFLLAKKNGVYVNEFAIGMGPLIYSFQKKETKYSIRAIPMGGFCAMLGEDEAVEDEHSFSTKSVWARIAVVVAGPVFNFILAFLLALVLIGICGYDAPRVGVFSDNSPAKEAGVKEGDIITRFNGHRIYNFREILVYMQFDQSGEDITLNVERDGKELEYTFSPEKTENGYKMGIALDEYEKGNALEVVKYSALELRYQIKTVFLSLKYLFTGKVGFKNMSGPVGIVSMMNDTINEAKESAGGDAGIAVINIVLNMLNFAILLSANLGVMNLLPFPALDGGRTLLLLVEAFFKKKLPAEKEAAINMVGFMLLIGLMVIVMFQDVSKIIH